MAEIELSVLTRQCLDRRIPDKQTFKQEVAAWEETRNREIHTALLAIHHSRCSNKTEATLPFNSKLTEY